MCILGKPNAGKSTLLNALFGNNKKVIVSDIPGTTRDSIDYEIEYNKKKYNLIDTAGIRRPGKINRGVEKFSTIRALNSIERSDITVLLIDGTEGITNQDCQIARHALEAEKGIIIAVNKIDLFKNLENKKMELIRVLKKRFPFIPWAPVIFISSLNKKNTRKIFDIAEKIILEREKRIKTSVLNNFLQKITQKHKPASPKLKKPKFMYASQIETSPPKFALFFKNASNLHFSYPRYIENNIRKEFGFEGTPINLKIKTKL